MGQLASVSAPKPRRQVSHVYQAPRTADPRPYLPSTIVETVVAVAIEVVMRTPNHDVAVQGPIEDEGDIAVRVNRDVHRHALGVRRCVTARGGIAVMDTARRDEAEDTAPQKRWGQPAANGVGGHGRTSSVYRVLA
jgi:hypothetical protein